MKLVKMSLAAAMLMGASAYAIDNVKVNGDAKVYYGTDSGDAGGQGGMFDKRNSFADTALRLSSTMDLLKNVSAGVTGYAVSTLGLENNLVNGTWTGAHDARTGTGATYHEVDDQAWIGELWVAGTAGKTTVKAGRMELDTPFAFSEKWSIVPNTFEGAVLVNKDLQDTTVVAGWIGKGNGINAVRSVNGNTLGTNNAQQPLLANSLALDGGVVGDGADFTTFAHGGAYTVGAINNSFKPLTAQAWYYSVDSIADAYWLQADIDCKMVPGVKIGAQYGEMSPDGVLVRAMPTIKDSSAYAFKLGYEGVENLNVSVSYSKADRDGTLKIANLATDNLETALSKLYTEAWWARGRVGDAGSTSMHAQGEYNVKDIAKFGVYYTNVDNEKSATSYYDINEVALTATRSFGPLDATLAYINIDEKGDAARTSQETDYLQIKLALNF